MQLFLSQGEAAECMIQDVCPDAVFPNSQTKVIRTMSLLCWSHAAIQSRGCPAVHEHVLCVISLDALRADETCRTSLF